MKKKYLAGAVIAALIINACTMPSSLEITTDKLKINAPVKTGTFNIATILSEKLADSFPDDFELYDMKNYPNVKAFLISYKMELMESFNPNDYLTDIKLKIKELDDISPADSKIYPNPVKIPKLTPAGMGSTEWLDLSDTINNVESQLNTASVQPVSEPFPNVMIGLGQTGVQLPSDLNDELEDIAIIDSSAAGAYQFDAMILASGTMSLVFKVLPDGGPLSSNIDISITGIAFQGKTSNGFIGIPASSQNAWLHSGNGFTDTIHIDLAGETIEMNDLPRFVVGGITDNFGGTPEQVSFNLEVTPIISGITLRGARGVQFGEIIQEIPASVADTIKLNSVPDGFINADISAGSLTLSARLPDNAALANTTYCDGVTIEYKIFIKQDPVSFDSEWFNGFSPTAGQPMEISGTSPLNYSLIGKKINNQALACVIKSDVPSGSTDYSQIIIRSVPGGANFVLYDDDIYDEDTVNPNTGAFNDKSLPVTVNTDMAIGEFSTVRWKLENNIGEPLIPIPAYEIDFGDIGGDDISKFMKSITYDTISLGIDFTVPNPAPVPPAGESALTPGAASLPPPLRDRLAMKVSCPELGFNNVIKKLNTANTNAAGNPNLNEFFGDSGTIVLKDAGGNPKVIPVVLDIVPVVGADWDTKTYKYMELGPLDVSGSGDTVLDIFGSTSFHFSWIRAEIDLKEALDSAGTDTGMLKGKFPEDSKDPVNLYEKAGKYMHGITLGNNVRAKMFFAGPHGLIDIMNPRLEFGAEWKERINFSNPDDDDPGNWLDNSDMFFSDALTVHDLVNLPVVTQDDTDLPPGGMNMGTNFVTALSAMPDKLRFNYELLLPTEPITVYPDTFDITESGSGLTAMFVMVIPLELIAEPNGYFSVPDDIFEEDGNPKDLFGREELKDSVFNDVTIRSLGVKINFDTAFFRGAVLHLDGNPDPARRLFPNGLQLNNGRNNSLEVNLSGNDWKIIQENMIYPKIQLAFPQGSEMIVPKNFMPTSITIAASGSYTIDFDDLKSGD